MLHLEEFYTVDFQKKKSKVNAVKKRAIFSFYLLGPSYVQGCIMVHAAIEYVCVSNIHRGCFMPIPLLISQKYSRKMHID